MNLSNLKPGQRARITSLEAVGPMRRRLMDMGLLAGSELEVEKVAPLGDPMEIRIRSYHLSLRRAEAEGVAVEVSP